MKRSNQNVYQYFLHVLRTGSNEKSTKKRSKITCFSALPLIKPIKPNPPNFQQGQERYILLQI